MIKGIGLIFLFVLIVSVSNAQIELDNGKGYLVTCKIIDGDTVPFISLREVIIIPPREFKNERERKRYQRLVRNIKKVLPYARIASSKFNEINNTLPNLKTEKERKQYIEKMNDELKAEFEDDIRNLTISQGRLLIKLIDRETGYTSYQVIKDLKGSFSAFMWQSIARMFGSNLKYEYDAEEEDKYIEEIIILIDNGQL
ncbi:MAG: DUF4294 domain-containing protein [Ignavibacteriaceae bacterium]